MIPTKAMAVIAVRVAMALVVFAQPLWGISFEASTFDELKTRCQEALAEASAELDFADGLRSHFSIDPVTARMAFAPGVRESKKQRVVERAILQAQEVAAFLRDLSRSSFPLQVPFKSVQVVARNIFGPWRTLELTGDVLILRMGRFGSVISSTEILRLWNKGEQFERRSFERRVWKYVNPSGAFAQKLKESLGISARALGINVAALFASASQNPLETGNTYSRESLIAFLRSALGVTEQAPALPLEASLRGMSAEEFSQWVERLRQALTQPSLVDNVVGGLGVVDLADSKGTPGHPGALEIRIVNSTVIQGNFHWIVVTSNFGGPLARTLVQASGAGLPRVRQGSVLILDSFVISYTVDVVEVSTHLEKLLLASAIEAASGAASP